MNSKLIYKNSFLIIASVFFACSGPVKEDRKDTSQASSFSLHVENENYVLIDTSKSVVSWKGSNSFGGHSGYVHLSKGELMIENGRLQGGSVEVDMNTIEDEDHRSDNGLIKHLKDPDFFDVKKFPFSKIVLTRVATINGEYNQVTGDLTIKGITHPVVFPAKMVVKDGIAEANGKLVIDRTRWNVRYGSGKLFNNLADKTISDSIELHFKIVTKK